MYFANFPKVFTFNIVKLKAFDDDRVYVIFRANNYPNKNIVLIVDFSLNTETYFGFHNESKLHILDIWEKSSTTYDLI